MTNPDIGDQSAVDIARSLRPGQFWAVIVALGTLLSGAFALGGKFSRVFVSEGADLVPCSKAEGYPMGDWISSGEVTSGPGTTDSEGKRHKIATDPAIHFDNAISGHWVLDEPMESRRTFSLGDALTPGNNVLITFTAKGDPGQQDYTSKFNAKVSPCGCFMAGSFEDSLGHIGVATYFWRGRDRYWVTKTLR